MKLNIMSDVHNEFSVLEPPQTDADVVILAGDIDTKLRAVPWAQRFEKPVIYVLGNHEFYGSQIERIIEKTREQAQGSNVHFLENNAVVVEGVRFIGTTLWTDFKLFGEATEEFAKLDALMRMTDYRVIRYTSRYRRLLPKDTQALYSMSVEFLQQQLKEPFDGKTVVVTHHAPSMKSVHEDYRHDSLTPSYASSLQYLMGEPVCLWVHGHMHHSIDYTVNGTRVVSNPRGYHPKGIMLPENRAFDPGFLVEI